MLRPTSRTLADLIEELAVRRPDGPAVSDARGTVTFSEFRERAVMLARALHADGVRSGDKVGILMGNRVEWLVVDFAVQYLGATMVALNTWYTDRELAYVLDHAGIGVLFMADRFLKRDYVGMLARLEPIPAAFPSLRRVVVLGDGGSGTMTGFEDYVARGSSVRAETVQELRRGVGSDDVACLLYTSGSTAHPKGVLLRHGDMLANTWEIGDRLHLDGSDVAYLPISLFWGLGCENAVPTCWQRGMHIVLQDHFDADEAIGLIEKHRCTTIFATTNIVMALFNHPDRGARDLGCLRKGASSGSADVSRRVIRDFIPGLCRPYGLTETYGYSSVNDADDPVERRATTDGRPLPGIELRIADPATDEPLGPGEVGEIRQRGHVMAGYHRAPEVTAQSFDKHGFFRTGDLGMIDQGGYLHFRGRSKEMIKTGGMNVSPAEVEAVLKAHPAIEDAFVTGVDDAARGEAVAALIVAAPDGAIAEDAVLEHCRASLAAYKVPRRVRFVSFGDLPLTTTGKVHRSRLRELFEDAAQVRG